MNFPLDFFVTLCYNSKAVKKRVCFAMHFLLFFVAVCEIEVWLSLVERCVRDAEAAGSSPVTSTIFRRHNGDNSHLTLVKSIPIYRGVFLFMPLKITRDYIIDR